MPTGKEEEEEEEKKNMMIMNMMMIRKNTFLKETNNRITLSLSEIRKSSTFPGNVSETFGAEILNTLK